MDDDDEKHMRTMLALNGLIGTLWKAASPSSLLQEQTVSTLCRYEHTEFTHYLRLHFLTGSGIKTFIMRSNTYMSVPEYLEKCFNIIEAKCE